MIGDAAQPQMTFEDDARDLMIAELCHMGYLATLNTTPTFDDAAKQYFNALRRRITPKQREVKRAFSMVVPPNYSTVVDAIQQKFENGDDVNPHLSRKLVKLNYNDKMLYEWGIQHLHLSLDPHPHLGNVLVEGTSDLLFAYTTNDTAYFLGIFDHNQWANQQIPETMWSNWENLLRPFVISNASLEYSPDAQERSELRGSNINTLTQVSTGQVIAPPGGGFATDGTSFFVMDRLRWLRRSLRQAAKQLRDQLAEHRQAADNGGKVFPPVPRFKLTSLKPLMIVTETTCDFPIKCGEWKEL